MSDPTRCCKEVASQGGFHFHQCHKKGTVTRAGKLYCKVHDPVAVKARRDAKQVEWENKWKAEAERDTQQRALIEKGRKYDALVAELKAGLEEISRDAWFGEAVRLRDIALKADELLKKLAEAQ